MGSNTAIPMETRACSQLSPAASLEVASDYAPFTFDNDGPGYDMCGFVRAIMRQLADTLANESVPWKKCKGRNCGKYFKYQQPKKPSKGTPHSDAIYCSRWCADNNAHAMKDKRERNQGCASGS